jgi:hypothetical protein
MKAEGGAGWAGACDEIPSMVSSEDPLQVKKLVKKLARLKEELIFSK